MQKKKIVLYLLVALVFITVLGCSKEEQVVLNVYNWGEYIDESVLDIFEEETGIKVNYEMYPTNEEMYMKLKAGGTKYDVIFPSDYMIEKLIKEDMLYELDFNNIPNVKNIDPRFTNLSFDPDNKYSVPYFWGTVGILYNTRLVDEEVDSWDMLWNPKYENQILMYDSQRDSIGVALLKLGYSLNSRDSEELEEAKNLLIEQRPLVLGYFIDEVKDIMIAEDAALALVWSGEAVDVISEHEHMAYAIPKEGSNIWFDAMVIPKTSQNKKEAEMFIDFMSRPDIALLNTLEVGYSTVNTEVLKQLDPALIANHAYNPSDEELARCEIFKDPGEFVRVYGDIWIEVMAK